MPPTRTIRMPAIAFIIGLLLATIGQADAATTSWTRQTTVNPAAQEDYLQAVSCVAASSCEAVGVYVTSSGLDVPLAEHWNGHGWSRQTIAPIAGSAGIVWTGVSCRASTWCDAVGGVTWANGTTVPLAERWTGSKWVRQAVPDVAGNAVWFRSIACVSVSDCEAVGTQASTTSPGFGGAFAERWDGSKWLRQAPANPTGAHQATFSAVSCSQATACEAVGSYLDPSSHMLSLAEHWNGAKWVHQTTVNLNNYGNLTGVSCPTSTRCVAVGSLVETWSGTTWTRRSAPTGEGVDQVTCLSPTDCEAVGGRTGGPAAARWNGSTWGIQSVANPTNNGSLFAVSCVSSTTCEAVGVYYDKTTALRSMAERY